MVRHFKLDRLPNDRRSVFPHNAHRFSSQAVGIISFHAAPLNSFFCFSTDPVDQFHHIIFAIPCQLEKQTTRRIVRRMATFHRGLSAPAKQKPRGGRFFACCAVFNWFDRRIVSARTGIYGIILQSGPLWQVSRLLPPYTPHGPPSFHMPCR